MPEPNIVLDCYPHEILCKIVNYAGVKNLFQLLDDSFLNLNGSVKRAVNKAIREILSYDYNNKGTADFKNADEVKRFDNHCVNEKLDVVLNLCYDVQTARDLRELQDVLTTFQPSDKTMLQLRIDFSECYCSLYKVYNKFLFFIKSNKVINKIKKKTKFCNLFFFSFLLIYLL